MNSSRTVGFVAFAGVTALDLIGPMDAFAAANTLLAAETVPYATIILGATGKTFSAESGITMQADVLLSDAPPLDTVVIPGGSGLRLPVVCSEVAAWLRERAPETRRVISVCTGVYALAASGLIDGRRATTHWRFATDIARLHPHVSFDPDAIFIRDGPYVTSAGVTAGIDLALSLIEEDHGSAIALTVARELVVYLKRSGGQLQYSEPLQFQTLATNEFSDLGHWLLAIPNSDLGAERLAERVGLSERQFRRRFEATFGASPARYVERLRLDEGRRRLENCGTVESIAQAVGYESGDSFRRSFERLFGIDPSSYRARFLAGNGG